MFTQSVQETSKDLLDFPWSDKDCYAQWLAQTYFFVRHTPRLLCAMGAKAALHETEMFNGILHGLEEENGHDIFLLNDLKNLGFDLSQFSPFPMTEVFVQNQYYWVQNNHPSVHLAYAVFLEGVACVAGPKISPTVKSLYGAKCATFIHSHATLDQEHFPEGLEALASTPESTHQILTQNLMQTKEVYSIIIRQIKTETLSQRQAA